MIKQSETDLEDIKQRFGFAVQCHRIGQVTLKIAQVERVDDMVDEIYPGALTRHGDAPVWMITWPAAFALAEYLLHNYNVTDKRILELGCGTAAPGIALARAGAQVVCTDNDPLALAMARYNARLNGCNRFKTCLLDWYRPNLNGYFDMIVGSEVVYFKKSFKPLLSVLKYYSAPDGRIVFTDQWRPQMKQFLQLCSKEDFAYREITQMVYLPDKNHPIRITVLNRP